MITRVLDTSVVAKWFLQETGSERADRYLDELADGMCRVVVPSSLLYELADIFGERRSRGLGDTEALSVWAALRALPLSVVGWEELLPRALALGFRDGIAPSDATFVLLARDLGCDLITADPLLFARAHPRCPWVKML